VPAGLDDCEQSLTQDEPGVVETAGDDHDLTSVGTGGSIGELVYGEQRRSEDPGADAVAAVRILVRLPSRQDVRSGGPPSGIHQQVAGASRPPPITTSSGSKVLMALAIPMPTRSPHSSTIRAATGSPSRAD